jgi:hypothetical protein
MNTFVNNDNVAVCRGIRKFIRDPKSKKRDPKMTRDKKSHKKILKEKVAKRVKETTEKKTRLEEQTKSAFRVLEPKPVKTALNKPKKMRKINSNENLLACLEDVEYAEEDALWDIFDIACDNKLSEYFKDVAEEEYREYLSQKEELECNDNLSRMQRIQKQDYCERYEKKMAPKKDRQRTFEEYEAERQQERSQWIDYKKHGVTRKMFCETLDYERNKKALEEDDDLNAEEMEKLIINIWVYEQNLAKWEMEERLKMENWFCNFEENNPDFVQKIRERNYCLANTIIQAIMD